MTSTSPTTGSDDPLDLGEIEPGQMQAWESRGESTQHAFIAERCVYCNVNSLDWDGESPCTPHPLVVYTTETPSG